MLRSVRIRAAVAVAAAIGLLLALASCGGTGPLPGATATGVVVIGATATGQGTIVAVTPGAAATPTFPPLPAYPGPTPDPVLDSCVLLNDRDVASLFTTAEVGQITHDLGPVDQVVFSTTPVSATQVTCVFYVFHRPGHTDQEFRQITYWVDVPVDSSGHELATVWAAAVAGAAQPVSGLGNMAFYANGRLSFDQDGLYITVEVIGTNIDPSTSAGQAQQLDLETQMARDILGRMPAR